MLIIEQQCCLDIDAIIVINNNIDYIIYKVMDIEQTSTTNSQQAPKQDTNIMVTSGQVDQMPTQALIHALFSSSHSNADPYTKQQISSIVGISQAWHIISRYYLQQQVDNNNKQSISTNMLILWLHIHIAGADDQALDTALDRLARLLTQNQQIRNNGVSKQNIITYLYLHYLSQYQSPQTKLAIYSKHLSKVKSIDLVSTSISKNGSSNSSFKASNMISNWWYQLLYCIVHQLHQQLAQNQQQPQQTLPQFINVFTTLIYPSLVTQYLEQPTTAVYMLIKDLLQLIASNQQEHQGVVQLRKIYVSKYMQYLDGCTDILYACVKNTHSTAADKIKSNLRAEQLMILKSKSFNRVKLLQLFHIADPTFSIKELSIINSKSMVEHVQGDTSSFINKQLYTCLCDFDTKGANALAVNVYGAIMKELGIYDESVQVFSDLYLMLDCYGMHLIKDIWDRFYILCKLANNRPHSPQPKVEKGPHRYMTYPISTLLHIILTKVEQHPNANVPKYCIQSLLSANLQYTISLFQHQDLQDMVYSSLVQILNSGTHYNDCTHFHQDSKIYALVKAFYLNYYHYIAKLGNISLEQKYNKLRLHVSKLISSMDKYITFEHCLMSFISIFSQLPILSQHKPQMNAYPLIARQQGQRLFRLVNRLLGKLCFRKKYKANQSLLKCLQSNINLKLLGLEWVLNQIIMDFSISILDVKVNLKMQSNQNREQGQIPKVYSIILSTFSAEEINELIKVLMQQSAIKHYELTQQQDLQQQQFKSQVAKYMKKQTQLTILTIISSYNPSSKQNENMSITNLRYIQNLTQNLSVLSKSLYAHPLQHSTCVHCISSAVLYSSEQYVNYLCQMNDASNGRWGQHLLIVISANNNNKLITENMEEVCASLRVVACGIKQSNSQPICKNYAKFIQYCIVKLSQQQSKAQDDEYFSLLLLSALKYKCTYTKVYKSLQSCLYQLYESQISQKGKQLKIPQKLRLRMEFLLFTILCNDFKYALNTLTNTNKWDYVTELSQYCNLYDYQHNEQFFAFTLAIAKIVTKGHQLKKFEQQKWEYFKQNIFNDLKQAVKIMLHNLEYGIHKKQVVSASQSVVQVALLLDLDQEGVNAIQYMIKTGENYWGFQRCTVFHFLNSISVFMSEDNKNKIGTFHRGLIKLLKNFICIQEYRGQDSSILMPQFNNFPVYHMHKMHQQSDYDGTSIRFVTIQWINKHLNQVSQAFRRQQDKRQGNYLKQSIKIWNDFFDQCLQVCVADNSKQKMFLTGSHKTKIKYCQILPTYANYLSITFSTKEYCQVALKILNALSQSNLTQIKHYLQTFLFKMLYLRPQPELLTQVSKELCKQMLHIDGQNTLLRNVSFMVISGIVLQIKYDQKLFTILFAFICSHVAYYRGISQYFCFRILQQKNEVIKMTQQVDYKYITILYKEYLKDQDAIKLNEKLHLIFQKYKRLINSWNIYDHLFVLKPTLNNQVVSQQHYIDKIKYLGTELVKQHKHEDGFMAYKQKWKKLIVQKQNNEFNNCTETLKKDGANLEMSQTNKVQLQTQSASFQRKIDPSLTDIYNFEPINNRKTISNNLKILVVSARHIAFYGHMARVGQILGIKQLCIPNLKIVDMQDFYNVSVTAEKWLNITEHKYEKIPKIRSKKQQKTKKEASRQNTKQMKQIKNKQKQQRKQEKQDKGQSSNIAIQKTQQLQEYEQVGKQYLLKILMQNKQQGYNLCIVKKKDINKRKSTENYQIEKKSLLIIDQLGYLQNQPVLQQLIRQSISYNQFYSYHVQATIFIWEYFKKYILQHD